MPCTAADLLCQWQVVKLTAAFATGSGEVSAGSRANRGKRAIEARWPAEARWPKQLPLQVEQRADC